MAPNRKTPSLWVEEGVGAAVGALIWPARWKQRLRHEAVPVILTSHTSNAGGDSLLPPPSSLHPSIPPSARRVKATGEEGARLRSPSKQRSVSFPAKKKGRKKKPDSSEHFSALMQTEEEEGGEEGSSCSWIPACTVNYCVVFNWKRGGNMSFDFQFIVSYYVDFNWLN